MEGNVNELTEQDKNGVSSQQNREQVRLFSLIV